MTSERLAPLRPARAPRRGQRGLTLIEVLIVVAIAAVLTGSLMFGPGMMTASRQRAAGTLILSSVRLAIARSNQTGKPVRVVFDLDAHRVLVEEANSPMLRVKDGDESTGAGAEPATEAERKAKEESDKILEGPRAPRARFSPVREFSDTPGGRELGRGIVFRQVQVEHDEEPRTAGRAYLYVWPGGTTERAAIQIRRDGVPDGITVMVSGLTGRAQIQSGNKELPEARKDEGYSEREDR